MEKQIYSFSHSMHEGTDDRFTIEKDYKGHIIVRIYQEMDSGILREIYLSGSDIRQIYAKLEEI